MSWGLLAELRGTEITSEFGSFIFIFPMKFYLTNKVN